MQFKEDYFSNSYAESRNKFLSTAADNGIQVETKLNQVACSPDGQELATDICYLGPGKPKRLLLISSGTHGVEGYCGSAVQTGLLRNNISEHLRGDTGLFLVHALNPYGFAYDRRVNEDNVDLNRNFVDFSNALPESTDFLNTRDQFYPKCWADSDWDSIEEKINAGIEEFGEKNFQKAMSSGQYSHADDPFWGGAQPTWSRKVWEEIIGRALSYTELIIHLDIHSGLGPSGKLERILPVQEKGIAYERAAEWYGEDLLSCPAFATSNSPKVVGYLASALTERCPGAVALGLEFGTVNLQEMLLSVIADNWLSHCRAPDPIQARKIKTRIKKAFYVDTYEWKQAIWAQSCDLVTQSLEGLYAL